MHQQVNIDLDFSLGKSLSACMVSISLNQDIIFCVSVEDTTTTGIQEGIPLYTLLCS